MTKPCQVDFYVLAPSSEPAEQVVCRLALMAWEQGHRVAICADGPEAARRLDELMWEEPPGRFLPHASGADDGSAPVHILPDNRAISAHRDTVINLCDEAVPDPARFARLLEIVPVDESRRAASRLKFSTYRAGGLPPRHHPVD